MQISIIDTRDPGSFRNGDQRRLSPGEEGTHEIAASVYDPAAVRWNITAASEQDAVEYFDDEKNEWKEYAISRDFGDTVRSLDDVKMITKSRQSTTPESEEYIDMFLRSAKFRVRHILAENGCSSLPHEIYSKILVRGCHPDTAVWQAPKEAEREFGRLRCL